VIEIRTAGPADLGAVGRILGQAFIDDPVLRWMQPDPRHRALLFRSLARYAHGLSGSSDVAEEDGAIVGAGLWDPPGYRQTKWNAIRSLPSLIRALGPRVNYGNDLEKTFHRHRPEGEFWYLAQLGAAPQGRGIGTMMVRHRIERIDGPVYLESSNEKNIPFYENLDFKVIREIQLPRGGPTCWGMYRI
jgi:ribosomal protein S18 acetylase RimI-like enzyme